MYIKGSDDEGRSRRSGSGSEFGSHRSGSGSGGEDYGDGEGEGEGVDEAAEEEEEIVMESSDEGFTRPNPDEEGLWSKVGDEPKQGVIRSPYERKVRMKKSERDRFMEWRRQREAGRPPTIHVHLKDMSVKEGHNVKLMTNVSGPELIIKWTKDGDPVERGPKYRILINEGIVGLEIIKPTAKDSGEYTCMASNQNGRTATSAIVTVYELMKDDPIPPTFTSVRGMNINDKQYISSMISDD